LALRSHFESRRNWRPAMRAVFRDLSSLVIVATSLALLSGTALAQQPPASTAAETQKQNQTCLQSHRPTNPGLEEECPAIAHRQHKVGCFGCQRAEKTDADAFEHNGATIAVIVSPKDCGGCHQKEVDEQKGSHHAKAGEILASLDNFLGEVV